MKYNRQFEIAWQGLKPGIHTYHFEVDDRLIRQFDEDTEIRDLKAQVKLTFDKKMNFFLTHFDVDGTVMLPCDRCGDEFPLQLWDEFDLLIKLSGEETEIREAESDVVFIPYSETVLDFSRWVYEFILLSIPLQRIHPEKENGVSGCNEQALILLKQMEMQKRPTGNTLSEELKSLKKEKKQDNSN